VLNKSECNLDKKLEHKLQIFLTTVFFHFGRKPPKILWINFKLKSFKMANFWPFVVVFFGKTEIQTVILRCLVCKNLNWIKSYNKILVQNSIFSCLKMHHFRGILPKWFVIPQKETRSHVFKMYICSKISLTFISGKMHAIKPFSELFSSNFFEYSWVRFFAHKTICSF
jgi:hypothetical protein